MTTMLTIGNRYQAIDLIAEGMMGPVYQGVDARTGRPVAIKALHAEKMAEHPSLLERFQREGEALRELNHPNIVHRLDLLEQDHRCPWRAPWKSASTWPTP
jgi:serine/threonine protein kinase